MPDTGLAGTDRTLTRGVVAAAKRDVQAAFPSRGAQRAASGHTALTTIEQAALRSTRRARSDTSIQSNFADHPQDRPANASAAGSAAFIGSLARDRAIVSLCKTFYAVSRRRTMAPGGISYALAVATVIGIAGHLLVSH